MQIQTDRRTHAQTDLERQRHPTRQTLIHSNHANTLRQTQRDTDIDTDGYKHTG